MDRNNISKQSVGELISQIVHDFKQRAYTLCQYKPAYGHIFADYIKEYTHWGYSDIDVVFGDLRRWITDEELTDYDIVSYTFGDQNIAYLRGQFTFHKNDPEKVNQLWRGCEYLSKRNEKEHRGFESAEGCYSWAVLGRKDVRVKWAVKADTDVDTSTAVQKSGLYMTSSSIGPTVLYKSSTDDPQAFRNLATKDPRWFEGDIIYRDYDHPLQVDIGKYEFVETSRDRNEKLGKRGCMYWAPMQYQPDLCLSDMSGDDRSQYNLYLIDGRLMKRRYKNIDIGGGGVVTVPFFHFQEWKRKFRRSQITELHRGNDFFASSHVILSLGVISQVWPDSLSAMVDAEARKKTADDFSAFSSQIITREVILTSETTNFPCMAYPLPTMEYCGKFLVHKHEGKRIVSCTDPFTYLDSDHVKVAVCPERDQFIDSHKMGIHAASGGDITVEDAAADITLILTAKFGADNVDALERTKREVANWQGRPSVAVFWQETCEVAEELGQQFDTMSNVLVVSFCGIGYNKASLLNIARDSARTRWTLSGLDVDSGATLSDTALPFAARGVANLINNPSDGDNKKNGDDENGFLGVRGNFFIIPTLTADKITTDLDALFADTSGEFIAKLAATGEEAWREVTSADLGFGEMRENDEFGSTKLTELQHKLTTDFANVRGDTGNRGFFFEEKGSPIILVDEFAPKDGNGQLTRLLSRYEEEMENCLPWLHVGQMLVLGYKLNVASGVYGVQGSEDRHNNSNDDDHCRDLFSDEEMKKVLTNFVVMTAKAATTQVAKW